MTHLRKYFLNIEIDHDIDYIPKDKVNEITTLIRRFDLELYINDLLKIASIISYEWRLIELEKEFKPKGVLNDYRQQGELLLDILKSPKSIYNITRIEFGKGGGLGIITNEQLISDLLQYFDKDTLLRDLESNILDQPRKNKGEKGLRTNFIDSVVVPFYNFVINETSINVESKNELYRFIHKFCITIGVDWNYFSTQDPADYLKSYIHKM